MPYGQGQRTDNALAAGLNGGDILSVSCSPIGPNGRDGEIATDQRIHKFFQHMRAAADLLEQILLSTSLPHGDEKQQVAKNDRRAIEATEQPRQERLAYTLKEIQELVGISRSPAASTLAAARPPS